MPAEREGLNVTRPDLQQPENMGGRDNIDIGYQPTDVWLEVPASEVNALPLGIPMGEVVVVYGAAKFLGPFLEEFAKKLGEKLGESTATALGRIRGRRSPEQTGLAIDVPAPNQQGNRHVTTTLLFPGAELSDAAKLAITELDFAADEIRGKTLRWDESIGTWWWVK